MLESLKITKLSTKDPLSRDNFQELPMVREEERSKIVGKAFSSIFLMKFGDFTIVMKSETFQLPRHIETNKEIWYVLD